MSAKADKAPKNWSKAFRQGNAVYQLNMLGDAAIRAIEDRFVAAVGVDIRTIRVLRLIGDAPGITFVDISSMTAMERSLTSRLIQKLNRLGYIERRNCESDARRFGLHITAEGQVVRERADAMSASGLELMFQKSSPEEVAAFTAMMGRLADWIDSDEFFEEAERKFAAFDGKTKAAE